MPRKPNRDAIQRAHPLSADEIRERQLDLPALLTAWRERHDITTVAEAARRLEIPYRTLQDWHLGRRIPRGFARRALIARLRR